MRQTTATIVLAIACAAATAQGAAAIPAFARKYRTSCSTCHTAAPKLNVLGEAFRLNGYRMPENDELLRREEPVPLGAEPWRDLWPRSIYPGEIPGAVPLAMRLQLDAYVTRDRGAGYSSSYEFPHEVYLLAGASLGEHIGAFLEAEWSREESLEFVQAKMKFQHVLPFLPDRALNVWVGLQDLYLFTFADRQIDRAARQGFRWQEFRLSDLTLTDPATAGTLRSDNTLQLGGTQQAIELNGIAGRRFYYGVGLAQGGGESGSDNNHHRDTYYELRYKLGGLRLDGTYAAGHGPLLGGGGQLRDRSLIVEHFGYFGAEPAAGGMEDRHHTFGVAVRALDGPLDVGVGYVWGRDDRPWGSGAAGAARRSSLFAKAEALVYPWLIGSLKFERFDVDIPGSVRALGYVRGDPDQTHVMPGVVFLIRQNIRAVLEGEFFTRHAASAELGERRPTNVWFRLDVAF